MADNLSQEALRNAILHCAKHPQKNVCGALIGSEIIDSSIPLFHSGMFLPALS